MFACHTGLCPIGIDDPGSKVKVTASKKDKKGHISAFFLIDETLKRTE